MSKQTQHQSRPKTTNTRVDNSVIQAEINANKVNIDKSVFQKTPAEKLMLKEMKLPKNLAKGFTEN